MKQPILPLLVAALLAVEAGAQASSTPPVAPGASTTRAKQNQAARSTAPKAKAVLPDPELLDGSKYEPEKRPLYGMISEIEMGEQESEQQDQVSPNSGPQNPSAPDPNAPQQAGGGSQQQPAAQPEQQQAGGSSEPIPQGGGPQAEAVGAQARSLQGAQGAQAQQGGPQPSSRDMQIGDATLQIQTVPQTPDMIGNEPSKAQQYEKPVPPGQQSNNRNQGVEKGKVIPKGL